MNYIYFTIKKNQFTQLYDIKNPIKYILDEIDRRNQESNDGNNRYVILSNNKN